MTFNELEAALASRSEVVANGIIQCGDVTLTVPAGTTLRGPNLQFSKNGGIVLNHGAGLENVYTITDNYDSETVAVRVNNTDKCRITDCCFVNYSYGVAGFYVSNLTIRDCWIHSRGPEGSTGGAIQLANVTSSVIENCYINSLSVAQFEHGIYIAGDVDNLRITGNRIENFRNYGIHFWGKTFVKGRRDIHITGNIIRDCKNGIIVGRAAPAGIGPVNRLWIRDNTVEVQNRGLLLAGNLTDVWVSGNAFLGGERLVEYIGAKTERLVAVAVSANQLRGGSYYNI